MKNKSFVSLNSLFKRALDEIRVRVCISDQDNSDATLMPDEDRSCPSLTIAIAIAYSGGLDSSVLLHLAHDYAAAHNVVFFAFHIHHGISSNADAWLAHCHDECKRLGIAFDARRVILSGRDKSGVEEAARMSRYAALGGLCRAYSAPVLLTAHHQDDQVETVFLQLLRGSGVPGIAGMDEISSAPDLLGDSNLILARPLLAVSREVLEDFARIRKISYIEDESNNDIRYTRNALRHGVMPSFSTFFPGFKDRIVRSAGHARSAQRLLNERAADDLAKTIAGDSLNISGLRQLSTDRIDNALRYWLASHGIRTPATSWLIELRIQLFNAREDAQICVTHGRHHIKRYRDRIFLVPAHDVEGFASMPITFRWDGERSLAFAAYRGELTFEDATEGVSIDWLRKQSLIICYRKGGESLKLAQNRPMRSLKQHYQTLDVPAWKRKILPLILTAESQLLFAGGIGMNYQYIGEPKGEGYIKFRWRVDGDY